MSRTAQRWRYDVVLFLISQGITLLGSQIVQMAIVWFITMNTGSGAWVAAFSIASYLPQFVVSFAGGILADRYSKKKLIMLSDSIIAIATLCVMLCQLNIVDEMRLIQNLLTVSVIRSAAAGIQNPSVNAAIADLVPELEYVRYNGLNATIQSLVQFMAPAAAVIALTFGSLSSVFMIDIITAAIGISMLLCLNISAVRTREVNGPIRINLLYGIRYVFARTEILNILILYGQFIWWSVPGGYLAGLYVSRTFGDSYWFLTIVELVGFGGMLLGGILMSSMNPCFNRNKTLSLGLAVFGFMSIAMSACCVYVLYLVCMLVYGIAMTVVQATITTILQEESSQQMRGRVFGLWSSIYAGIYPLAMAVFGVLSDMLQLTCLMTVSGIVLIMISLVVKMKRNGGCLS